MTGPETQLAKDARSVHGIATCGVVVSTVLLTQTLHEKFNCGLLTKQHSLVHFVKFSTIIQILRIW